MLRLVVTMSTSRRWKITSVTLIVLVVVAVVFYLGSSKPIGLFGATVSTTETSETFRSEETCRNGGSIRFGEFLLYNNMWGAPVGEPQTTLCIKTFSSESFGWNWSRPLPSTNVTVYPQVIWGRKAEFALNEKSTTDKLPVAVDSLISLELSLDLSTDADGEYDLAFDIWITNSSTAWGHALAPTHEIMIWLLWSPSQAGHSIEQAPIHGTVDDGHTRYYHRDLGRATGIWELHIFTIQEQGVPAKINFVPFFHHVWAEGYTRPRYLSSIDFMNEVWYGKGETIVTTYHFDVKATMQSLENGISSTTTELESLYALFLAASVTIPQVSNRKVHCTVLKPNTPWRRTASVVTAL